MQNIVALTNAITNVAMATPEGIREAVNAVIQGLQNRALELDGEMIAVEATNESQVGFGAYGNGTAKVTITSVYDVDADEEFGEIEYWLDFDQNGTIVGIE